MKRIIVFTYQDKTDRKGQVRCLSVEQKRRTSDFKAYIARLVAKHLKELSKEGFITDNVCFRAYDVCDEEATLAKGWAGIMLESVAKIMGYQEAYTFDPHGCNYTIQVECE